MRVLGVLKIGRESVCAYGGKKGKGKKVHLLPLLLDGPYGGEKKGGIFFTHFYDVGW